MGSGAGWLQGMDVSKWQATTPDLTGVNYLIARGGVGTKPDGMFTTHLANGKKAGIQVFGSYWYNIGALTPAEEVAAYIAVEKTSPVPLDIHVIDWEGADGFTAAQAAEFISIYKKTTGDPIWLYASESRFRDLGQDHNWIANYSQEPTKAFDIWQYGPYHGADGNYFAGTLSDLKALVGRPTMDIIAIKAEDWLPTKNATTGASNGVFHSLPERAAPVIDRVDMGVTVRSIAEVTGPAGDNWRMTERAGKVAFMLRSDWTPLVQGGDPTTDSLLDKVIQRLPLADTSALQATIDQQSATISGLKTDLASAQAATTTAQTKLAATYAKIDGLKG